MPLRPVYRGPWLFKNPYTLWTTLRVFLASQIAQKNLSTSTVTALYKLRLFAPILAAALMLPLGAAAQPLSKNEALVLKAMDEVFNKRDVSAITRYWGTPYIQHNPGVPNGHEGLIGLVKNLGPNFKFEPGMIASRGDIVMIHGRYSGWGPKPMVIVDIFRIKDGKFVEHWDVVQEEIPTSETKSGNPMFTPINHGK